MIKLLVFMKKLPHLNDESSGVFGSRSMAQ